MKTAWPFASIILALTFATAQDVVGDFTRSPNEHIINDIEQPFVVQSVRGYVFLDYKDNRPLPDVLFEIQGSGTNKRIRRTTTNKLGRFGLRHVPDGTYRFKTTLMSYQSAMGTIIVSRKIAKLDEIKVMMPVGK